jgi:hypothetical protein
VKNVFDEKEIQVIVVHAAFPAPFYEKIMPFRCKFLPERTVIIA